MDCHGDLAALAALFLCHLTTRDWRDSTIRSLVIFGTLVTGITEGLAAGCRRAGLRSAPFPQLAILDVIGLIGIVAIVAITGFIALLSPPNNSDAMAYHMPRVVYWAQRGSVGRFSDALPESIMLQPLAEHFMLHTYVLSDGDRFVNLVQWLAMVGCAIGVSRIAQLCVHPSAAILRGALYERRAQRRATSLVFQLPQSGSDRRLCGIPSLMLDATVLL